LVTISENVIYSEFFSVDRELFCIFQPTKTWNKIPSLNCVYT